MTDSPWPDAIDAPGERFIDPMAMASGDDSEPLPPADWSGVIGLGVLLAAGGLWMRSLSDIEPRNMTELGLNSVLPSTFFVAVALLTVGFVVLVSRPDPHGPLLAAYLGAFAVVAHATPVVASGSLGDSWAWANVGVVDHVQRLGELPSAGGPRSSPMEWPGMYGFIALVSDVTGIEAATLAMWMPLATALVGLLAVRVLCRAFTSDERIVWTALWLFSVGGWVGPNHLSPHALSLTLGISLLAVALPLDRFRGGQPVLEHNIGPSDGTVAALAGAVAFIGVVGLAIVASSSVTPVVLAATFAVAALTRTSRTWWLAIGLAVGTALWFAWPASSAAGDGLSLFGPTGAPAQFATTTTRGLSALSSGAQTVLIAGRFVAQAVVVLALIGLVVRWRGRRPVGFLVGALLVPVIVVVADPGIESLLRWFALALPWLALVGAFALARPASGRRPIGDLGIGLVVVGALTATFLVAQSGERGAGYFTSSEVEIAAWVSGSAPAETLLIEVSGNGPFGGRDIERFERVSLAESSAESLAALAADPESALHERMVAADAEGFAASFVVLTRSQGHGESIAPRLPGGLLDAIDADLRRSDRFTVVGENADAVVFALAGGAA